MLSQYTWGDFCLFIVGLLVIYYIVVAVVFYRPHLKALMSGKKLAPAEAGVNPRKLRPAASDDLIETASAYTGAGAASDEVVASTETGAGAADNLTGGQEQLVAGKLPDSIAATGDNVAPGEATTAEAAGGTATNEAAHYEEEENEELLPDVVSEEMKKQVLEVTASEKATNEGNFSESLPTFVNDENDIAYEETTSSQTSGLEDYDVVVASTLNVVTEQAAVYNADDVSSYLTELQDGQDVVEESVSKKFAGTSLGLTEQFIQNTAAAESKIADLFAFANSSAA